MNSLACLLPYVKRALLYLSASITMRLCSFVWCSWVEEKALEM